MWGGSPSSWSPPRAKATRVRPLPLGATVKLGHGSTSCATVVAPWSPGRGGSLRVFQAPVAAAEVQQRLAVGMGPLDPAGPPQEHRVVAAVVGRLDVALQVGEGAVEQGGAGDRARVPADGHELGHAAGPARVREV